MSSAAEAKLSRLFITAKDMIPIRQTLIEMGWPQPKNLIQTDNSTVVSVTNRTNAPNHTNSTDIRFYWLHCHKYQYQFRYYWAPIASNLSNYSTKHHTPLYHEAHWFNHAGINVRYTDSLKGCVAPQSLYP